MRFGCDVISQWLKQVVEQLIATATRQDVDFCTQGDGPGNEVGPVGALAFERATQYAGDGYAGERGGDIGPVGDVIAQCKGVLATAFEANGVEVEQ